MERKEFLKAMVTGAAGITTLSSFNQFTSGLKEQDSPMPVLFIGHGSPMNGIENNEFSQKWKSLAKELPTPQAVLVISAHWLSKGTRITAMDFPKTIHDFGGFPKELFEVQYGAPGSPSLATETVRVVKSAHIELDHDWGLDHGAWTVVRQMYPEAQIPVLQLSIDYTKSPQYHYELAKELYGLRKKGVLIIGSGNMVHNLRMVAWDRLNDSEYGYDWAIQMNDTFKNLIKNEQHDKLIRYDLLGREALLSIPTPEHYFPILYTLGLKGERDEPHFFNDKVVAGSLTMTSVKFG